MLHDQPSDQDVLEVSLTPKDVAAAKRLLRVLGGANRRGPEAIYSDPAPGEIDRQILVARAHQAFLNRRRRAKVFGQSMFGEAAWDMLLALYITEKSGPRQTVGALMKLSGTPMTTANRWLAFLVSHGLVRRDEHPTDRRTVHVTLTPAGRSKLDEYFSGTVQTAV